MRTGWRYESARHALAARGIPTGRRYNYVPTYVAGDLPLIAGDAVGTAGASAVSLIPVAVPALMVYGGAKYIKGKMKKVKKAKRKKRKYDAAKHVDDVSEYVSREMGSNGEKRDFLHEVGEQIRHPIRDMDGDWKSMVTASGHKYKKENGIALAEDRAAATVGKVLTQANVEPLVDKDEVHEPARAQMLDILFGRRAYNAYKPGSQTLKTVNKLRFTPVRRVKSQPVASKEERDAVMPGDRVAVIAEGVGRKRDFVGPDKLWLRVTSRKRKKLIGRIEEGGRYAPFSPFRKVGFSVNNIVEVQRSLNRPLPVHRLGHKQYMFDMGAAVNVADNFLIREDRQ